MSNVISNLTKSTRNLLNAASGTLAATSELVLDGTELLNSGVSATPSVLKATLQSPFEATKGYLVEAEGVTPEEAHERAYAITKLTPEQAINRVSSLLGKAAAMAMEDDEVDTKLTLEQRNQKTTASK